MKKKIINGLLLVALVVATTSSFVSCKDYDGENYAVQQEKNASLQKLIDDLDYRLSNLNIPAECDCPDWTNAVTTLQNQVKDLQALLGESKKGDNEQTIVARLAELEQTKIKFEALLNDINANTAWREANATAFQTINTWYTNNYEAIEELKNFNIVYGEKIKELLERSLADKSYVDEAYNLADEAKTLAEQKIGQDELDAAVDQINISLDEIREAFKQADEDLLAEITEMLEYIISDMYNKVSSVIIQRTENPVMGSAALPFGIQTNVLAAYYGYAGAQGAKFPTADGTYYADITQAEDLTAYDKAALAAIGGEKVDIEANGLIFNEAAGNAGTLYLTVNPTNINYRGVEFALVDSKDQESGIKLEALEPADKLFNFGWTRASISEPAENGLYAAQATLAAEDLASVKDHIWFDNVKATARQLLEQRGGIDISTIANTIYANVSNILPAYAVKAAWQNTIASYESGNAEQRVYSGYELATTAVKPFSFSTLGAFDAHKYIPTVKEIAEIELGLQFNIDPLDINIEFVKAEAGAAPIPCIIATPNADGEGYAYGHVTQYSNGAYWYFDRDNTYEFDAFYLEGVLYIDLSSYLNDLMDQIEGQLDGIVEEVNQTLTSIDQLNAQLDQLEAKANSYVQTINSYIQKINAYGSKLADYINTANARLQPVLLWNTAAGATYHIVANSPGFTQVAAGTSIILYPTTYTAELFAPAFKKAVVVSRVTDAAGNEVADAKEAANKGANMNEVVDGRRIYTGLTLASQAGLTYEILYTAIDYYGRVSTQKFYVTTK